jgi:hypothetical protein
VYDMYPWGKHAAADPGQAARGEWGGEQPSQERRVPGRRPPGLAQAVQVALDRRDNGGDAAAEPAAALARQ